MKYINAAEVLPAAVLEEIRKYTKGQLLYIPREKGRQKWGEQNGAREYYRQRNREIQELYERGETVDRIADQFGLSFETVRKILYRKQTD